MGVHTHLCLYAHLCLFVFLCAGVGMGVYVRLYLFVYTCVCFVYACKYCRVMNWYLLLWRAYAREGIFQKIFLILEKNFRLAIFYVKRPLTGCEKNNAEVRLPRAHLTRSSTVLNDQIVR